MAIIEKLGHTKDLQKQRREWINEGKPQDKGEIGSSHVEKQPTMEQRRSKSHDDNHMSSNAHQRVTTSAANNYEDDDLYSASPRNTRQTIESGQRDLSVVNDLNENLFVSENEADNLPSEYDLEAFLAEDIRDKYRSKSADKTLPMLEGGRERPELEFEDEMEAMAEMDYML